MCALTMGEFWLLPFAEDPGGGNPPLAWRMPEADELAPVGCMPPLLPAGARLPPPLRPLLPFAGDGALGSPSNPSRGGEVQPERSLPKRRSTQPSWSSSSGSPGSPERSEDQPKPWPVLPRSEEADRG